jgi:hypothetical protein
MYVLFHERGPKSCMYAFKSKVPDISCCCSNKAVTRHTEKLADDPSPAPIGSLEVKIIFRDGSFLKINTSHMFQSFRVLYALLSTYSSKLFLMYDIQFSNMRCTVFFCGMYSSMTDCKTEQ